MCNHGSVVRVVVIGKSFFTLRLRGGQRRQGRTGRLVEKLRGKVNFKCKNTGSAQEAARSTRREVATDRQIQAAFQSMEARFVTAQNHNDGMEVRSRDFVMQWPSRSKGGEAVVAVITGVKTSSKSFVGRSCHFQCC